MRILHTSDWHLGRNFGPLSLLDDQQKFLEWMLDVVRSERVDLVVVAGDLFDRPVAPNDAIALFRSTLRQLQSLNVRVAAITGNHDGPERVANYHDLLDASGVVLRGGYSQVGEVITLDFADGPLDIVPLPYLDPQMAPDPHGAAETTGDSGDDGERATGDAYQRLIQRTHESVLRDAIAAVVPQLTAGRRSLAIAHAFVLGSKTSESEKKLTVGGHGEVAADLFDAFSYTALGHLHRPQVVAGRDTVRYSGTPLSYSFSEDHPKSLTMVDMAADGACSCEQVRVPVGRGVLTVTGTMEELLGAKPSSRDREAFVRVILTDRGVVLDAKQRLSSLYPFLVDIIPQPEGVVDGAVVTVVDAVRLSPMAVTELFWKASDGGDPLPEERALLTTALTDAERSLA